MLAHECGPLGHIDVGTSAGLNLLLPRYGYRYQPGGDVGDLSTVTLECGVRGVGPIPTELPAWRARSGSTGRPSTSETTTPLAGSKRASGRTNRTGSSGCGRRSRWPERHHPTCAPATPSTIWQRSCARWRRRARIPSSPTVGCSATSPTSQRQAYVAELDGLGAEFDLSWVYAESPALVPGLPRPDGHLDDVTVLSVARWRAGARTVTHLARCHPHGYWLHWMHLTGSLSVSGEMAQTLQRGRTRWRPTRMTTSGSSSNRNETVGIRCTPERRAANQVVGEFVVPVGARRSRTRGARHHSQLGDDPTSHVGAGRHRGRVVTDPVIGRRCGR